MLLNFLQILNGIVKGFSKIYILLSLGSFFIQTFSLSNWILLKNINISSTPVQVYG